MSLRRFLTLALWATSTAFALAKDEVPEPPEERDEPEFSPNLNVKVSASFPQSEIFGVKLVNGHQTQALLSFHNEETNPVVLQFVGGSLWQDPGPNEEAPTQVRNLTSQRYNMQIPAGEKESISYQFSTIMHPQSLRLSLMAILTTDKGAVYTLNAYNETVSVVEPDASFFDPQLIFLYLLLFGLFVGSSYFIYNTWIAALFPQKSRGGKGGDRARKSTTGVKKVDPSGQVSVMGADGPAVTSGAKAFDESWIPEHHLNRPEARRVKSSGSRPRSSKGKAE